MAAAAGQPGLDPSQLAVLSLGDAESAAVLGAPGTGKTTVIRELVAERVMQRGWSPDDIVVLTPSRASATRLRDALALRLGRATNGPLARTVNSLAFEIVGNAARLAGAEPPRLVTGGDQDADIAQLLEGHILEGGGPEWPEQLGPEVRRLRGFRTELRDLLMRATEFDVSPQRLAQLGRSHGRPEWVAAANFSDEYFTVISASRQAQLDPTELAQFAVAALGRGEAGERIDRLRLVVVDDLQEATEATLSLLRALAARGVAVVAFGDPDVAANAFRGGEPDALGRLSTVLGVAGLRTLQLETVHRQGALLRTFTSRITERIGTAAAGTQRRATVVPGADAGAVTVLQAATPARELAAIARQLREAHLGGGVPWSQLAVVVRSGAAIAAVRRSLALAEVPARASLAATALRDDRAARALLLLVDVGIGRNPLTAALAADLLCGPFGGLDALGLRRLRLALRTEEIAGGGSRPADDLLVDGLSAPGRFVTIDHRVGRTADHLAGTFAALRTGFEAGATIEELLWLAWERSGLARTWQEQALGVGIAADEANANLDGVVALFTAATRFVERQPGTGATVFLANVLDAEVPEDTLSPQTAEDAVLVTTPSGTIGLEFDTVIVAGLQDGGWPNLRLRGSLLGAQQLAALATGIDETAIDARRAVLDDELRIFALAVSRARRHVILSAVANDDESPSVFFGLAPEGTVTLDTASLPPLSLRGFTGRLRRELVTARDRDAASNAASALRQLADQRVPGADPDDWHGLREPSTDEPLFADDETVPVSPSQLEKFERSPVEWFLEWAAGGAPSTAMAVGTIVHWVMETATEPDVEALWAAIESRWGELVFESPWIADFQRRAVRELAVGVAEYLADSRRRGDRVVAAEHRFALEVDRARVNGSIDRVEATPDGAVVIMDLKTGAPVTRQDAIDENAQLAAYQLAYAEGQLDEFLGDVPGHRPGGAKLLFVRDGVGGKHYREGTQPPLTDEQLEQFRDRIRQVATGMALARFTGSLAGTGHGAPGARSALSLHGVGAVSGD